MTWGSMAEVHEPESLRQKIRAEAERMASQYEAPAVVEESHCCSPGPTVSS